MDAALVDFVNGLPSLSCALVSTYDDLADGRAVVYFYQFKYYRIWRFSSQK